MTILSQNCFISVIFYLYPYFLSMDKYEGSNLLTEKNPSMENLKDKRILSKDKKMDGIER